MDSNGTRFQLLSSAEDFSADANSTCEWDEATGLLRLVGQQRGRFADVATESALGAWANAAPLVQDSQGQLGFLSEDSRQLQYSLTWPIEDPRPVLASSETGFGGNLGEVALDPVDAPEGSTFVDVHLGGDGRAALPYTNGSDQHGLLVVHLGRRWQRRCRLVDEPGRAWVDHLNRVWVAADQTLTLCAGEPLPQPYFPDPARFEPVDVNPTPLDRVWRQALPLGFELLAMTADDHQLYLLMAHVEDRHQELFVRSLNESADEPIRRLALPELPLVIDLAPLAANRLVLMLVAEASAENPPLDLPVIDIVGDETELLARRYPQHSQTLPRFITGNPNQVRYLSQVGPKRLHRLQQARFLNHGHAILNRVLDSGEPDALWHRIYIDGCVPPGCELEIEVKAFAAIDDPGSDWQRQSKPHWQPIAAEIPFYEGRFSSQGPGQGLFEVFLQREHGAVREIRGRYLQVRVNMRGDGRHSPAIAAMRIYHPRFSWQQAYLPEHFHQQEQPGSDLGPANGADVRERMLASFEGMMTPIESRLAASECWLYPHATPEKRLGALANMVGAEIPGHWPSARKRNWIACQGELQRQRGTFAGLSLALDIASDGAVSRGQIVPVENYRLRRTLATILGIDMSDAEHPLTLGTGQSGNSIVGESLILSDEESKEFLALFAPELAESEAERAVVEAFFDRYANRLSVVVHGDARAILETIKPILSEYVPAHLQWTLIETDHPFVLGLSPLLGIDTYLQRQPAWRNIVLNNLFLGREGILRNPITFSPTRATGSQGDLA